MGASTKQALTESLKNLEDKDRCLEEFAAISDFEIKAVSWN